MVDGGSYCRAEYCKVLLVGAHAPRLQSWYELKYKIQMMGTFSLSQKLVNV